MRGAHSSVTAVEAKVHLSCASLLACLQLCLAVQIPYLPNIQLLTPALPFTLIKLLASSMHLS
jgi:hypothetical protein